MQDFAKVNSLSPQINASTQKQRRNTGINPRDKLQIGLVDLPLALPWMCAISYLDMPSGLQHPHTNTQDIHNTSLWSDTKPSELTFTHLPPKPSAETTGCPPASQLWAEKHELSLWLFLITPAGEPTELLPVHTVFCDIPWSLLPPTTTTIGLGMATRQSVLQGERIDRQGAPKVFSRENLGGR